jgi:hypothetical protein
MLDISALLAVPPHFADKGTRVWITDPPGAFDIIDTENATAEQVRFVIDIIERALPKHPLRSKKTVAASGSCTTTARLVATRAVRARSGPSFRRR